MQGTVVEVGSQEIWLPWQQIIIEYIMIRMGEGRGREREEEGEGKGERGEGREREREGEGKGERGEGRERENVVLTSNTGLSTLGKLDGRTENSTCVPANPFYIVRKAKVCTC